MQAKKQTCFHCDAITPGDSEWPGGLECCSPWGHKELDMTEQLNNNKDIPVGAQWALWRLPRRYRLNVSAPPHSPSPYVET